MMVRPKKRVQDYRTHVTGLTAADLQVCGGLSEARTRQRPSLACCCCCRMHGIRALAITLTEARACTRCAPLGPSFCPPHLH